MNMGELKPPQMGKQQEIPKGRRICAWCKKDLGPADSEGDTHSICEKCLERVSKEEGLGLEK